MKKGESKNELIAENRTFFCSELVAKAFKILGIILDDDKSCTQYYPHHFSTKGSILNLTPGTVIDEELQVIVDKDDFLHTQIMDEIEEGD